MSNWHIVMDQPIWELDRESLLELSVPELVEMVEMLRRSIEALQRELADQDG